jgi:hypothetical protein
MACDDHPFDTAKDPDRCKCKGAVERAYFSMVKAGRPANVAIEAARIIYQYHHPEDPRDVAHLTVERWVNEGRYH